MAKATKKSNRKPAPKKPDPIFAAIAEQRRLYKAEYDAYRKLDVARGKCEKRFGDRPCLFIAWRRHSALGGSAIETARDEFLEEGFDRKLIHKEYADAKARLRAAVRAEKAWYKKAGLVALQRASERALAAERRSAMKMAKTVPTTPAGAAAILAYALEDIEGGECDWHAPAIATVVTTLKAWNKAVPR